jgi:hypothetical protein
MKYRDELELIVMIGMLVVGTIGLVMLVRSAWI